MQRLINTFFGDKDKKVEEAKAKEPSAEEKAKEEKATRRLFSWIKGVQSGFAALAPSMSVSDKLHLGDWSQLITNLNSGDPRVQTYPKKVEVLENLFIEQAGGVDKVAYFIMQLNTDSEKNNNHFARMLGLMLKNLYKEDREGYEVKREKEGRKETHREDASALLFPNARKDSRSLSAGYSSLRDEVSKKKPEGRREVLQRELVKLRELELVADKSGKRTVKEESKATETDTPAVMTPRKRTNS